MTEDRCAACAGRVPGSRCIALPHAARPFPVERLCDLAAADPGRWGPEIRRRTLGETLEPPRIERPRSVPYAPVPPRHGPAPARELVVAHYKAPLAWLAQVPAAVDRITVYAKGPACDVPADPRVVVVPRPNVGREAEVIAAHVEAAWDSLAGITLFAQDAPDDHCHARDFLARLVHDYREPTPLSDQYSDDFPPDWIKARDRVEVRFGHAVRYGDARIEGNGPYADPWFNDAAWAHVFAAPCPRPLWFGYGAQWAVPRAHLRRRPRAAWAWLAREIVAGERSKPGATWTDPPLNPWMAEAIWAHVFSVTPLRPGIVPAKPRVRLGEAPP